VGKLRRRARALVDLEYGPQFNQIRDLFGQAETQYRNDRVGARETAKAVQAEAKASRPVVKDIYRDARKDLKSSNSFVDKAIATLDVPQTGLTGLLSQATQRERGTARTQNVAERRAALNDLVQRASSAEAGKALGYTVARQNLRSTNKDLTQRLVDLTGQSQAKMTALLADMRADRADVRAKAKEAQGKVDAAAGKTITSGVFRGLTQGELDGMTAKEKQDWIKAHDTTMGTKGRPKSNRRTAVQQTALSNEVQKALSVAHTYAPHNTRPQLANTLLAGAPASKDPKTGEVDPGIPSFGQLAATLALDMAYDGHISRANARRLHRLGYRVKDIAGAVSYADYMANARADHEDRLPGGRP
jgi:hypothetical protein